MTNDQIRKIRLTLIVGGMALQGVTFANILNDNFKKSDQINYLADILNRDIDQLTDFDQIALKNLGLLRNI